ncbi:MAG: hypothetical protein IKO61_11495 [Lachnospiraceae bacterium]|nr:hypothetical protein [Lachnospiraceae bacterium]
MDKISEFFRILGRLISASQTDNEAVDNFVFTSAEYLEYVAFVGVLLLLLFNPKLRKHKSAEDRCMFYECVLVIGILFLSIGTGLIVEFGLPMFFFNVNNISSIMEILYLLILVQWLVCVDYSLFRSRDHIKRRYKHAVIPVIVLVVLEEAHVWVIEHVDSISEGYLDIVSGVLYYLKIVIELSYIVTAVILEKKHFKETKEPRFLRLEAFGIPFILGVLFRFYDASLIALGIILTYKAMKRRDRYIDGQTGFYNRDYLDYLREYRRKLGDTKEGGIYIEAKGHRDEMAELISEIKPVNIDVFALDSDSFYLRSDTDRKSALLMIAMTIDEAVRQSDEPYEALIDIKTPA